LQLWIPFVFVVYLDMTTVVTASSIDAAGSGGAAAELE
jgi:hypothetical protein